MPCLSIILFDKPDLVWYVLHQTDVKNMHLYIFRPNTSSSSQQRKEREREKNGLMVTLRKREVADFLHKSAYFYTQQVGIKTTISINSINLLGL